MSQSLEQIVSQTDDAAFYPIAEEILAGESVLTYGHFRFESGETFDTASSTWDLLDSDGVVYSSGNSHDIQVNQDTFGTSVLVTAYVSCPSDLPPTSHRKRYQIRWTLAFPLSEERKPIHFLQGIRVLGLTSAPLGPVHLVEVEGDDFTLEMVTDIGDDITMTGAIYTSSNSKVGDLTVAAPPTEVSSGYLFTSRVTVSTFSPGGNPFSASLDPYVAIWKGIQPSRPSSALRFTSEIYIVNPSILSAMESVRRMVSKARTTLFQQEDLLFDPVTMMSWLRRGRDMFNGASGLLTEFSMVDATGGVREFWIRYAEVSMLMAQSLAEGEKAFNYSGQAISLEVDKASVYQQMADSLKSQLDNDIKPLKQNLLKKGVSGGTGNLNGVASGSRAPSAVGIGLHPASQLPRSGVWRGW